MQNQDFLIHLQILQIGHGWLKLHIEVFNTFDKQCAPLPEK